MTSEGQVRSRSTVLATVLIVVLALGGGMMAASLLLKPAADFSELSATVFQQPRALQPFELLDHHGADFTNASLAGHWSFLFFGYTHCPDVCPTSMAMLGQVQRNLAKDPNTGELPQVVFFSVDPERDTPELLASFVPYFHDSFIGVTGDADEILKLTRQLGIIYGKVEGSGNDDYLVDHSAAIILFDPEGRFRALFNVPHQPEYIVTDLQAIKQYYEATR